MFPYQFQSYYSLIFNNKNVTASVESINFNPIIVLFLTSDIAAGGAQVAFQSYYSLIFNLVKPTLNNSPLIFQSYYSLIFNQ